MYILCPSCTFGVRVTGSTEEIDGLLGPESPRRGVYLCPNCGTGCTRAPFVDSGLLATKHVRALTPFEAHLLLEGMGFPEERDCVAETVVNELATKRVTAVRAFTVPNTTRTVVHSLTMDDGTTLFLSGSAHGAIVYRIRKPNPYLSAEER